MVESPKSPVPRSGRKPRSRKARRNTTGKSKADGGRGREEIASAKTSGQGPGQPKAKVSHRPSDYTDALATEICERILLGETIRQITGDDHMPDERTVYRWLVKQEAFRQQYAHAREESGHVAADGVTEIGQKVQDGLIEPDAARVAIDALKWAAGKRKPKVYGDKVQVGGDPDNPFEHVHTIKRVIVDPRTAT